MATALEGLDARPPSWPILAGAAVLVGAGIGTILLSPVKGAVLIALTPSHGLHTGDLLALLAVAAAYARVSTVRAPATRRPRRLATTALVPAGAALVAVALLNVNDSFQAAAPPVALVCALAILALGGAGSCLFFRSSLGARSAPGVPALAAAVPALLAGCLLDGAFLPSGTAFGAMLLAISVCVSPERRLVDRAHYVLIATCLGGLNTAALADLAGLDVVLAHNGGGVFRTLALGTVLVAGGTVDLLTGSRGAPDARQPECSVAER
ncbi:MAG: hypothetical protein ACRDY5_07515 [Acidimicrobiales bacterium]